VIKEIGINNYQSLRSVRLVLGRVTVVVGHSDAGKSALMRALHALCFNQEGSSFIHRFQDKDGQVHIKEPAEVAIAFNDGYAILWRRFESTHAYVLFVPGKEKQVFTKTGGAVPPEVSDVLNIRPVTIEEKRKERLHFAFQHDLPFLVGDRGGVATSRVLGRLTGLHIFANAAKNCTANKDQLSALLAATKTKRDRWKERLQPFETLPAILTSFQQLQEAYEALQARQAQLSKLQQLQTRLQALQLQREKLHAGDGVSINVLQEQLASILRVSERLRTCREIRKRLIQTLSLRRALREQAQPLPSLPSVDHYRRLAKLRLLSSQSVKLQVQRELQQRAEYDLKVELEGWEREATSMRAAQQGPCPFCGQPMKGT
jgi:DNA repair ATPase RecN